MFKQGRNCATQCGVCTVYATPRRLLSGIPKVVSSVSRHMLQRLERTGMFARVQRKTVVRTAFDFTGDAPPRSDKPPGSHLTVGYLGRLEDVKGIELLLRAVQQMPAGGITLLVAGNGVPAYVDDLKRRFRSANIQFLGFTDPAAFFARIDAVVVPSIWEEPLSRVIFEGCALGVPAIVARMGGMPEIVEEGITGYVFEPNDVAALVKQLQSLVEKGLPAERLRAACLRKSQDFSVDEVFRAHMSNWRHAIARQSPGVRPVDSMEIS
jgi:glycosyltransferase involved in cell wall biosynthesis